MQQREEKGRDIGMEKRRKGGMEERREGGMEEPPFTFDNKNQRKFFTMKSKLRCVLECIRKTFESMTSVSIGPSSNQPSMGESHDYYYNIITHGSGVMRTPRPH